MKKLTLALGSLVSIAAPVSAVVACGSSESKGFSYQSTEALMPRTTSIETVQTTVDVSAQSAVTDTAIATKGSTIASFVKGVYTHTTAKATTTDVKAPHSIEAIAKANRDSNIASTGHYSILINLLKAELNDAEALKVHNAFVLAYNSKSITNPKPNSLDAKALYTALQATGLGAKLNFDMFK